MAGIFSINVQEARGFVAIPADIDRLAVVMGCSSAGSGLSAFYLSGTAAIAGVGYGDAVDTLCQVIEQQLPTGSGVKYPAAFYKVAQGTAGSYGALSLSQVVGTARPANNAALSPRGTYEAAVRVVDDGNDGAGGLVGTSGILYETSLDNGRHWSTTRALGIATTIEIANREIGWTLDPPAAQVTALISYANAIRTAFLAHILYVAGTVHGSTDTSSDDGIAAAVTNLATVVTLLPTLLAGLVAHLARGTTVHIAADVTTSLATVTTAVATATASGTAQDAITATLLLEAALEAHEALLTAHTIADAVNVVSATQPIRGTLFTGDTWMIRTLGPVPGSSDIDAGFAALAAGSVDFRLLVCDWPMNASLAARVTAGLALLRSRGKRLTALCRARIPDFETSESEATWLESVAADFSTFFNSSTVWRGSYALVTDAMTGNQYLRSTLQQFAADTVRSPRALWPCAPADPQTGLGGEPNVTMIDANGVTVGHDEGPRGTATGLSNDALGNRFSCEMRIPESTVRESVFNTVPWVMYAPDERVRNMMTRRLANAMESVAVQAGLLALGAKVFVIRTTPQATTGTLRPESRKALQGAIFAAVSGEFATEIDNAKDAAIDTGLVQVSAGVTISGGNLIGVSATLAPRVGSYVLSLSLTFAVQE